MKCGDLFTEVGKQTEVVARQKQGAKRVPKFVEAAEGKEGSQVQFSTFKIHLYLQV